MSVASVSVLDAKSEENLSRSNRRDWDSSCWEQPNNRAKYSHRADIRRTRKHFKSTHPEHQNNSRVCWIHNVFMRMLCFLKCVIHTKLWNMRYLAYRFPDACLFKLGPLDIKCFRLKYRTCDLNWNKKSQKYNILFLLFRHIEEVKNLYSIQPSFYVTAWVRQQSYQNTTFKNCFCLVPGSRKHLLYNHPTV